MVKKESLEKYKAENYRMERTNKKACPYCGSVNVIDTGARIGNVGFIPPGRAIPKANIIMYECKNCNKFFLLISAS